MASFTTSMSSTTVGLINDDRMSARGQKFRNVRKETVIPSTLFGQPLHTATGVHEAPTEEASTVSPATPVSPATEQKSDVQALIDERQTTRVRRVLTRRLAMLFNSFSSEDSRVMYTRKDGRKVTLRAFIMSLSTRVVDRALNPQSRAKTSTKIVEGVVQTGQLDPFKYVNRSKDQQNILTLNVSKGKVSGLQLPSWSVRAQKGRHVPRHTIIEHAQHVSSELWSYAMELISGLTAVQVIGPMLNEGFGRWKYIVKIGRVKVKCEHGDNLITRILWAAGQLATSEHRSKGRNGERTTVQMPEDYDTNEHMEVIKTFDQVDIQQAVKEMYPLKKCPGALESTKDKRARQKFNSDQMNKRLKGVELFSAIRAASIGQVSEIQLTRTIIHPDGTTEYGEQFFMKALAVHNKGLSRKAGQSIRVDEMHKVTDDICQQVVDLISRPECTLQWAKAQRDQLTRYSMFVPNGQKFMSLFTNIMRRKDVQEFMSYAADHFGVDGMPLCKGAPYDGVPTSSNPDTVKMTSVMTMRPHMGGMTELDDNVQDCTRVKRVVQWYIAEDGELFRGEKRYSYNPELQGILAQCNEQTNYRRWLMENCSE